MKTLLFLTFCALILSCTNPDFEKGSKDSLTETALSEVQIKSFSFMKEDNPGLSEDRHGFIYDNKIIIEIPEILSLENLIADFSLSEKTVLLVNEEEQAAKVTPNNFYAPVNYKLLNSDGKTISYQAEVIYDKNLVFLPKFLKIQKNEAGYIYEEISAFRDGNQYSFELPAEVNTENIILSFETGEKSKILIDDKEIKSGSTALTLNNRTNLILRNDNIGMLNFSITVNRKGFVPLSKILDNALAGGNNLIAAGGKFNFNLPEGITITVTESENLEITDDFTIKPVDINKNRHIIFMISRKGDNAKLYKTFYHKVQNTEISDESKNEEEKPKEDSVTENQDQNKEPVNPQGNVLIYGFASEGSGGVSDEFVILYNNSDKNVDLSGYRVRYSAASGKTTTNKYIFPDNLYTLGSGKYLLIAGSSYVKAGWSGDNEPDIVLDKEFSFAKKSGHIILENSSNEELDRVGYGDALFPEKEAVSNSSNGFYIYRINPAVDTDNNASDFTSAVSAGGELKNNNSK